MYLMNTLETQEKTQETYHEYFFPRKNSANIPTGHEFLFVSVHLSPQVFPCLQRLVSSLLMSMAFSFDANPVRVLIWYLNDALGCPTLSFISS